jgi:hypothetical protein
VPVLYVTVGIAAAGIQKAVARFCVPENRKMLRTERMPDDTMDAVTVLAGIDVARYWKHLSDRMTQIVWTDEESSV